jgi:nitroreductase
MKETENTTTRNQVSEKEKSLLELLERRWSPRSFSDEKIPPETIVKIFDAGRTIMSSFNEQPWRVILASKDDAHYDKLFDCLVEFNQKWVKTAPCLGVVLGKKHFSKNEKLNRHRFYDSGAFMAASTLRATSLDLFVHQMAGFTPEKVTENLNVPEEFEPPTMFVIGKKAAPEQLPEDLQKQERKKTDRNEVDDFLFGAKWGISYTSSGNKKSE